MLTEDERKKVRDAVEAAEKGLRAEIVPCVFAQSSHYPEAVWAGGAAGAALAFSALVVLELNHPLWIPVHVQLLSIPVAGLIGAALGRRFKPLRRLLAGPHHMEEAVARRAKELFFDRGLDKTKARDGVLIFLSLLERRAVVLADAAVRAKVRDEDWRPVVAAVTAHACDGRLADGLAAGIKEAGRVLRAAGLGGAAARELPDDAVEDDGE